MAELQPWLTVAEVAAYFRVDPSTIGRWVKLGNLKAHTTPSGRYRFRREDVEAFLPSEQTA